MKREDALEAQQFANEFYWYPEGEKNLKIKLALIRDVYERAVEIERERHAVKSKAPSVKREEPIEIVADLLYCGENSVLKGRWSVLAPATFGNDKPTRTSVRLMECPDSSRVLSKQDLEKAIDQVPLSMDSFERFEIIKQLWKQLEKA